MVYEIETIWKLKNMIRIYRNSESIFESLVINADEMFIIEKLRKSFSLLINTNDVSVDVLTENITPVLNSECREIIFFGNSSEDYYGAIYDTIADMGLSKIKITFFNENTISEVINYFLIITEKDAVDKIIIIDHFADDIARKEYYKNEIIKVL